MSYEVLARKWRPQKFSDLVGQDHVVRTLTNALSRGRLAHAYLFVGPRGTGKTSTARLLAKSVNCAEGVTPTPCGRCDSCLEIAAGRSMDVLEIDGASNNGVEQVRELRAAVQYAPTRGRFKIYIIDEVHMLTQQAFNALLKTLEEPPPHVKFFFATTEPQRIPATIISRCQRFDLRRIARRAMIGRLAEIAAAENVDVDPRAMEAIARGSEGALRDAESALDQLISFCEGRIREEDVIGVFGLAAADQVRALAESVLDGDTGATLRGVRDLCEAGKDLFRLLIDLMEELRALLLCSVTGDPGSLLDLPDETVADLQEAARRWKTDRIVAVLDVLAEAESTMRWASSKRIALELVLVRALRAARGVSVEEVLDRLAAMKDSLEGGGGDGEGDAVSGAAADAAARKPPAAREDRALFRVAEDAGRGSDAPVNVLPAQEGMPGTESAVARRDPEGIWSVLIERLEAESPRVAAYLKAGRPEGILGDAFVVVFGEDARFHADCLGRPRHRSIVESVLKTAAGRPLQFNTRIEAGASGAQTEAVPDRRSRRGGVRERAIADPVVRDILQLFDGRLIEVRS